MWWLEKLCGVVRRRPMWRSGALAVVGALVLAGCGFQPLYSRAGGDVDGQLAQIHVATIPDRNGQILHNLLLDRLNPGGRPDDSLYRLGTKLSVSRTNLGIKRDETSTRARLSVRAIFSVTGPGEVAQTFTITRVSSYSQTESSYATLVAEQDAIRRSLREIADDARLRLAVLIRTGALDAGPHEDTAASG